MTARALLPLLLACGPPVVRGPGAPETESEPGETPLLVDVAHRRELRGIWVATVSNIDFPSKTGLSPTQARDELVEMVEVVQSSGFNAIFFQIRPEGDALYRSELEPWSRFLTGIQGEDPGLDPLEVLVQEAHARNIEVHVWMNPYRAGIRATNVLAYPHLGRTHPEAVVVYGDLLWMDPGQTVVQDRLIAVVEDVVRRYDIDGVHFDDYFYPYPIEGKPFPDAPTYSSYQRSGGTLSLGDWRRDNVNQMVKRVAATIAEIRPAVRFGISPFGIYRPGQPAGISGFDAYAGLYADPVAWGTAGDVHYLAPQLYWPTTQRAQAFEPLVGWWSAVPGPQDTFAGLYLSKLGASDAWSLAEFEEQVRLSRLHQRNAGNLWFSYRPLHEDREGVRAWFRTLYPDIASLPPIPGSEGGWEPPEVEVTETGVSVSHREEPASWLVYADGTLTKKAPAAEPEVALSPGRYAISALSKDGRESRGVEVQVR